MDPIPQGHSIHIHDYRGLPCCCTINGTVHEMVEKRPTPIIETEDRKWFVFNNPDSPFDTFQEAVDSLDSIVNGVLKIPLGSFE